MFYNNFLVDSPVRLSLSCCTNDITASIQIFAIQKYQNLQIMIQVLFGEKCSKKFLGFLLFIGKHEIPYSEI